jgi:hypothetical protein
VSVVRKGKGLKGRALGIALSVAGAGMLRSQMAHALGRVSPAKGGPAI